MANRKDRTDGHGDSMAWGTNDSTLDERQRLVPNWFRSFGQWRRHWTGGERKAHGVIQNLLTKRMQILVPLAVLCVLLKGSSIPCMGQATNSFQWFTPSVVFSLEMEDPNRGFQIQESENILWSSNGYRSLQCDWGSTCLSCWSQKGGRGLKWSVTGLCQC